MLPIVPASIIAIHAFQRGLSDFGFTVRLQTGTVSIGSDSWSLLLLLLSAAAATPSVSSTSGNGLNFSTTCTVGPGESWDDEFVHVRSRAATDP